MTVRDLDLSRASRGARRHVERIALIALVALSLASFPLACSSGTSGGTTGGNEKLTAVSPAKGTARGGVVVTLTGTDFGSSPKVTFGGKAATVSHSTSTTIEATTPAGLAGEVDVAVTAGGMPSTLTKGFTYEALPLSLFDVAWARLPALTVEAGASAIADGNKDGHLDVFQAARSEGVWIYPNGGKAMFGTPKLITLAGAPRMGGVGVSTPVDASSVVAADFDGDGKIDLFVGTTGGTPSQLLLGDGSLGFTASTGLPAMLLGTSQRAVAVDIDGDGDLDLVTIGSTIAATGDAGTMGTPGVVILLNDGHGNFTDVTATRVPGGTWNASGIAVGDVDGDGDVDLFFAGNQEPCRLYLNDGHGTFELASADAIPSMAMPGAGMPALGDLDGDGTLDIYLPTATQDRAFFNDGTGHFTDLTSVRLGATATGGASATLVDLDLDGHLDVAVVTGAGLVRLYRNDGTGTLFDYTGDIASGAALPAAGDIAAADLDEDGVPDLFVSRPGLVRSALLVNWSPLSTPDTDADGVPDSVDNCPSVPNPDQADAYHLPFHCDSAAHCAATTGCELIALATSSYLYCKTPAASWTDASTACTAFGGNLVTVPSADVNAFLVGAGATSVWIGYSDTTTSGTYAWASGSTSAYTNWATGNPATTAGDDCVELGADGTWTNTACTGKLAYVCEEPRIQKTGMGDACDCATPAALDGGVPACDTSPDAGAGDGG